MLSLTLLRLKELFSYKLLVIMLISCPALFGFFSSYALAERGRSLSIAVYNADGGAESTGFVDGLSRLYHLNIIAAESEAEGKTLTDRRAVEGMLFIRPGFSDNMKRNIRDLLVYTAAPGTRSSELISEVFSLTIIHMRAETLLTEALSIISGQAVLDGRIAFSNYIQNEPVVSAVFHDKSTATELFISPKHGLAAVFMTLSFLISIFMLPGREKSLISIFSVKARIMDYTARSVTILFLFFAAAGIYFTGCIFIYRSMPSCPEVFACAALAVFCTGLGAVTVLFIKDKRTGIYLYIPFLLLNMTIGGAVWGRVFNISAPFKLILPSAVFLDAGINQLEPAIMALIGLALLICGAYFSIKSPRIQVKE